MFSSRVAVTIRFLSVIQNSTSSDMWSNFYFYWKPTISSYVGILEWNALNATIYSHLLFDVRLAHVFVGQFGILELLRELSYPDQALEILEGCGFCETVPQREAG